MGERDGSEMKKSPRWGYTTGTCAAAASLAAALMLLEKRRQEQVTVTTPGGVRLNLEVEDITMGDEWVSCAVKKDAGDDPDVTDGMLVYSEVSKRNFAPREDGGGYSFKKDGINLKLYGGVGVGTATKPGLSCEVGKPAINPVPRKMIFEQAAAVCEKNGFAGTLFIRISVPGGQEMAARTFNPRMGIEGGISILGTSGMVEPMSRQALLETIRLELRQKHLVGQDTLILTPGNYGEAFLRDSLDLNLDDAVKCSNFIGESIDMAAEEGIKEILLVGHGGKLVKVAAGVMNTHSSVADGRMEVLAAHGAACGADRNMVSEILESISVDQGLKILEQMEGLREQVMERVMGRIHRHLRHRAGGRLSIEALVFTNERGILGRTEGAERLISYFAART